ncbi:hypothetical protein BHM03_00052156 [Ensete ventricosum]|nr:hypothetical protein BHM03_00052156 [Ensete ventricosum]
MVGTRATPRPSYARPIATAGGNAGVARGPRGPRHWRETQSDGGQPGGGEAGSGPKPLIHVRDNGAPPHLYWPTWVERTPYAKVTSQSVHITSPKREEHQRIRRQWEDLPRFDGHGQICRPRCKLDPLVVPAVNSNK